jgi:hypothetical protein
MGQHPYLRHAHRNRDLALLTWSTVPMLAADQATYVCSFITTPLRDAISAAIPNFLIEECRSVIRKGQYATDEIKANPG